MILVDTSVMIRALGHRRQSAKVQLFERIVEQDIPFAICPFVYQETLQGVADEVTYRRVKRYLDTQECLWLPHALATYEEAAHLYGGLRREGVTFHTVDVLIALTAIHHGAQLLHEDRDFDLMAQHVPALKICHTPASVVLPDAG